MSTPQQPGNSVDPQQSAADTTVALETGEPGSIIAEEEHPSVVTTTVEHRTGEPEAARTRVTQNNAEDNIRNQGVHESNSVGVLPETTQLTVHDDPENKGHDPPAATAEPLGEVLSSQAGTPSLTESVPARNALEKGSVRSSSPPSPPPKDEKYMNLRKDVPNRPPSPRKPELHVRTQRANDAEYDEKNGGEEGEAADMDSSRSEIQSIMEQFDPGMGGPGMEEIMSPRLEMAGPPLGSPTMHPPRHSSLEPAQPGAIPPAISDASSQEPLPPRSSSPHSASASISPPNVPEPALPPRPPSIFKPPPPQPDPEPDLPFDFHRFLEQLRHRTADPVAKFLRSFLLEFGKKQWMVHEQVKIISDFLEFISKKMAQCEVWRTVSDAEFDNAKEGMEKLVMNRLYTQTFSPAIPPSEPAPGAKGRRKGAQTSTGPRRRGQHQEDVERDEVLAQKVSIYGWVKEEQLDIKPVGDKGQKFLQLAQKELLKINSYRAPRDKVICVLNCCKVIFGFLRNSQSDQSADSFVPLLIYVVLRANPEHLVSNVQYILRFRNQDKLGGEAGYYVSSLMGAVQFIENLDRTSLTINDADFERNVEAAVSAIAERNSLEQEQQARYTSPHMHISEKSTISRPEVTPRNSLDAERATPRQFTPSRNGTRTSTEEGDGEENAAVAGLLRTIQRPLSTIGRIFSDDSTPTSHSSSSYAPGAPVLTPQPGSTPRLSPAPPSAQRRSSDEGTRRSPDRRSAEEQRRRQAERQTTDRDIHRLSAEDAAARQASAEAEEARRIQRQEHQVVVETLAGMFPGLDKEVIGDVVRMKEGRVGQAVDACLALSSGA